MPKPLPPRGVLYGVRCSYHPRPVAGGGTSAHPCRRQRRGQAAAQLAKHLGATVIGTSRSADKAGAREDLRSGRRIDTSRTALRAAVSEPVNLVLDVIGGPALADHVALLAPKGRLVILVSWPGVRRRSSWSPCCTSGSRSSQRDALAGPEERAALVGELAERLVPLFEPGDGEPVLRPVVDRTYPMEQIAEP